MKFCCNDDKLLKQVPHMDTTEQTKRYMGLIK